ncbi:hypothetical protein V7S43_008493 [Phytophthora oleae]|uniref:Uncharacterized protein n=1 Tax=Phytophthora oleae TaxID=2107226 RepID=A0ABD3FH24_9STRA
MLDVLDVPEFGERRGEKELLDVLVVEVAAGALSSWTSGMNTARDRGTTGCGGREGAGRVECGHRWSKGLLDRLDIGIVTAKSETQTLSISLAPMLTLRHVVCKKVVQSTNGALKPDTITLKSRRSGGCCRRSSPCRATSQWRARSLTTAHPQVNHQAHASVVRSKKPFAALKIRKPLEYAADQEENGVETFTKSLVEEKLLTTEAAKAYYMHQ